MHTDKKAQKAMTKNSELMRKIQCLLLFMLFGLKVFAQTPDVNGIIYVKPIATGDGTGSSWLNATSNLQGAINAAGVQKVFVSIGNYNVPDPNSFVMRNGVAIYGGFDPVNNITTLNDTRIMPSANDTVGSVLNGKNVRTVIGNNSNGLDSTAVLDGFLIKNGNASGISGRGGGIRNVGSSPLYRNLVIKDNTATQFGGGMYNQSSSPRLINCSFAGNFSGNGGGMFNLDNSSPALINCSLTGNTATTDGAGIYNLSGNGIFINVTMASNGNSGFYAFGFTYWKNSIIWDAITGNGYSASYSLIKDKSDTTNGNKDATGSTITDIFTNPTLGDYTLKINSLAVNNGSNALFVGLNGNTKDLAGNARVYRYTTGGIIDLGAYESLYDSPLSADTGHIIYVKEIATGTGSGNTWNNATNDLYHAIQTDNVHKVFVANGIYNVGDNSFIMKNGVEIYGGFNPSSNIKTLADHRIMPDASNNLSGSILNGAQTRPVIWNYNNGLNATGVLDGFTITGGSGASGAGIYNRNTSPTLRNLVIRNNTATVSGGGMYNWGSSPTIINTVFKSNSVTGTSGSTVSGGAIYNGNASAPVLSNVNIVSNLVLSSGTENGAGIYNDNSSPKIYNSILYKNIKQWSGATVGADIQNTGSGTVTLKNSITQTYTTGNTSDNNLIGLDPLFTDVNNGIYTLQAASPAIDAGNNNYIPSGITLDLAGNFRESGNNVDLGVYEFQGNSVLPITLLSFTVEKDKEVALLKWTTVSEQNNQGFEIERSTDAKNWYKIGFQPSKSENGNSSQKLEYRFVDNLPMIGNNFYRLKQIDFDGKKENSPIRNVIFDEQRDIKIYPNPAKEQISISGLQGGETIIIYDLYGRVISQLKTNHSQTTIALGNIGNGTYLIQLMQGDFIVATREIIVVQ
ncbi:MAG: T9SS type A sorting domain-containing protein [Chitinophagales bacterium]|nr:T9SS type A sorting domain-containing protein [Chitinophagales bacterium]